MDVVFLIGRILFAAIFVVSGLTGHIAQREQAVPYVRAKGGPAPELMVPLSGVVIVLGGLSVALGIWADLGALLLVAFVLSVAPIMHAFWKESDPQMQQLQMAEFMKNIGLAGAGLIVFYAYNQLGDDAGLSITGPLFD
jgi:uncharacterized membrane protein YphA (DoxX/SURF4 family)